jgi:hypothetical protein
MRLMPLVVDAIIDRTPPPVAPQTMLMPSISDSTLMHTPPTSGMRRAMYSSTSVDGVMG